MTHTYFADFSNFVAFGEFVSIDLRVKVRNMVSGRAVKALSVSTKLPEYTLQEGVYSEVVKALNKCFSDLAEMADKEGLTFLSAYIRDTWSLSSDKLFGDKDSVAVMGWPAIMAYAIGQVLAFNYDWDKGLVSWS